MHSTRRHASPRGEEGFVLITSMLILVVLTLIGIIATRNTSTELAISGNYTRHFEAFTAADSGTEYASEMIEINFPCAGFSNTGGGKFTPNIVYTHTGGDGQSGIIIEGNIVALTGTPNTLNADFSSNEWDFWSERIEEAADAGETMPDGSAIDKVAASATSAQKAAHYKQYYPSDKFRDFCFPAGFCNPWGQEFHTNVTVQGRIRLGAGAAIQMAAGYEGKGKGLGGGGSFMEYWVAAQHVGTNNSTAEVCTRWRHMIDAPGSCFY